MIVNRAILCFVILCSYSCSETAFETRYSACSQNIKVVMCGYNVGDMPWGHLPYIKPSLLLHNSNDYPISFLGTKLINYLDSDLPIEYSIKSNFSIDILEPRDSALIEFNSFFPELDTLELQSPNILLVTNFDTCRIILERDYFIYDIRKDNKRNKYSHLLRLFD